jgi:hypothetical protein
VARKRYTQRSIAGFTRVATVPWENLVQVISGGQAGTDRIALEVAQECGLETGGWAPRKFMTCFGPAPELGTTFGLKEVDDINMVARSKMNVDASDGTLAFRITESPGTDSTIGYALTRRWTKLTTLPPTLYKPCLVITPALLASPDRCVSKIIAFLSSCNIAVLNVAGHRSTRMDADTKLKIRNVLRMVFRITRAAVNGDCS